MNRRTSVRVHEAQKDESHMKQTAMLTTASLLTILLMTIHLTGDVRLVASDGLTVRTAQTSPKAAEGQDATTRLDPRGGGRRFGR